MHCTISAGKRVPDPLNTYHYLAYGSNLHPERLRRRVPSAVLRGTCFLPDYSLRFHKTSNVDASGKCNIVRGTEGVFVAIYAIDVAERAILDRIEGLGNGYSDMQIEAPGFGSCSTYTAEPRVIDESLCPMDWYREYVVRGARFHGFPEDYIARLESIVVEEDTDMTRAEREWGNVRTLK